MNFKKYIKENTGLVISDLFLKAVTKTGYIDELNDEELLQLIKDSYLVKEYFKGTLDGPQELQKLAMFEIEMMVALCEKKELCQEWEKDFGEGKISIYYMNQGHDVLEKIIRNKMDMSKNSVLFVVNKSEDAKEIELYLSTLLDLGCEDFHFFGRHSNAWRNACDILDIERRPEDDEIVSLTSTYDSIDGFSESLLISNEFVCVFYDDAEVMQKLVQRIISN